MNEVKPLSVIVSQVAQIEQMLIESEGQITPEIENMLVVKETNLPEKIDGYAAVIERFEMIQEHYKKRAQEISSIAKSAGEVAERCKENIRQALRILDKKEIKGHDVVFKLSLSNPKVIIEDESKIDPAYKVTETIVSVDRKRIAEELKLGVPVDGAHLEETYALRKSLNRGKK